MFSFILGIGTEETAATCTSSRNFLKSLSAIFLPEDCYCSSFTLNLVWRFFSGVPLAEIFFGVGGLVFSFYAAAAFADCDFGLVFYGEGDGSVLTTFLAVDVTEAFLTDDFAALTFAALALRLEATDFLIAATDNDFRDLADDLGVPAVFDAAAFLLEALLFLTGLLLTALIVISESVLPNLSVFDVLTLTGALGTVLCSKSSILRALRRCLASSTSLRIASLGLSVFSKAAISFIVMISGLVALLRNG